MGGELMLRRRGMTRPRRLPVGYQEVAWIGNTGQGSAWGYIDTGITPNQNIRLKGKFRGIAPFRDRAGSGNSSYSLAIATYSKDSTKRYLRFEYGSKETPATSVTIPSAFLREVGGFENEDYEIDLNKNSYTLNLNGVSETWTADANTFTAPHTLCLLGLLNSISSNMEPGQGRDYWSQMFDENGVLVRDYVACVRISDGKPGLYDLTGSICPLTNTPLYVSASGGEFDDIGAAIL